MSKKKPELSILDYLETHKKLRLEVKDGIVTGAPEGFEYLVGWTNENVDVLIKMLGLEVRDLREGD